MSYTFTLLDLLAVNHRGHQHRHTFHNIVTGLVYAGVKFDQKITLGDVAMLSGSQDAWNAIMVLPVEALNDMIKVLLMSLERTCIGKPQPDKDECLKQLRKYVAGKKFSYEKLYDSYRKLLLSIPFRPGLERKYYVARAVSLVARAATTGWAEAFVYLSEALGQSAHAADDCLAEQMLQAADIVTVFPPSVQLPDKHRPPHPLDITFKVAIDDDSGDVGLRIKRSAYIKANPFMRAQIILETKD